MSVKSKQVSRSVKARLWRWLRNTVLSLLSLCVIVLSGLYALITTERGSGWLIEQSLAQLPGSAIASYKGTLANGMDIEGLLIPLDAADIGIAKIHSRWQLWEIFQGGIGIQELIAVDVDIRVKPSLEDNSAVYPEIGPWPNLGLPFPLIVSKVEVQNLRIAQNGTSYLIEHLGLAMRSGLNETQIDKFVFAMGPHKVNLQGNIANQAPYAMTLNIDWQSSLTNLEKLSGRGNIHGDLRDFTLQHQLVVPAEIHSKAKIKIPFDTEQLKINLEDIVFVIDSHWSDIAIPGALLTSATASPTDSDQIVTSTGKLSLNGQGFNYNVQFEGDASTQPQQNPKSSLSAILATPLQLKLTASGQQLNIQLETLRAQSALGDIDIKGELNADTLLDSLVNQPLTWNIEVLAKNIQTERLLADWPVVLDAKLKSRGLWQGKHFLIDLDIDHLQGLIAGKKLQATGALSLSEQTQTFKQLQISMGDNHLSANGILAESSSLDWTLQANNLKQLLPDLAGQIISSGTIRGGGLRNILDEHNHPQIRATVAAKKLRYQGFAAASSKLDFSFDKNDNIQLSLQGKDIRGGGLQKAQIQLDLEGLLSQHHIRVELQDADNKMMLALSGGLKPPAKTKSSASSTPAPIHWLGELVAAELENPILKNWQLSKPSQVSVQAGNIAIEELCLEQSPSTENTLPASKVCSAFALKQDNIVAQGQLAHISLEQLTAGLPPESQIQGHFNGSFKFAGTVPELNGEISLHADDIVIHYQASADQDVIDHHASLSLLAVLKKGSVHSETNFAIAEVGSVIANIDTDGLSPTSSLNGQLRGQFDTLRWLGGFFPELEQLDGKLHTELMITGSTAEPNIVGAIQLSELEMQLAALGIDLQDGEVELLLNKLGDWQLQGQIRSGEGHIALSGQGLFNVQNGLTGEIAIRGEQFTAADLPDANVLVSPDLHIKLEAERIKIRGQLLIPKGKFIVKSLPEQAASVSADERIISSHTPTPVSNAKIIDTLITVILDDSFEFGGFGLNTRLGGKLRISQKSAAEMQAFGSLSLYDGVYKAYGQDLSIQRGLLILQGPLDNPGLNITAIREVKAITVGINIGGFAQDIRSDVFSNPSLPPTKIIAILITGKVPSEMSKSDANQAMNAATALGISQSKGIASALQNTLGIDMVNLQSGETYEESSLVVGKYLTPDIFVSYVQNLFTPAGSVQLDYSLSKNLGLKAQSGKTQSVDLLYKIEHGKN